jgi:hypothetical protein
VFAHLGQLTGWRLHVELSAQVLLPLFGGIYPIRIGQGHKARALVRCYPWDWAKTVSNSATKVVFGAPSGSFVGVGLTNFTNRKSLDNRARGIGPRG